MSEYVLVPKEPTAEMITRGWNESAKELAGAAASRACYKAMIAAAPAADNVTGSKEGILAPMLDEQFVEAVASAAFECGAYNPDAVNDKEVFEYDALRGKLKTAKKALLQRMNALRALAKQDRNNHE